MLYFLSASVAKQFKANPHIFTEANVFDRQFAAAAWTDQFLSYKQHNDFLSKGVESPSVVAG
jgi:hypothetical protein